MRTLTITVANKERFMTEVDGWSVENGALFIYRNHGGNEKDQRPFCAFAPGFWSEVYEGKFPSSKGKE